MNTGWSACVSQRGFDSITILGCVLPRVSQRCRFISMSLISALQRMAGGMGLAQMRATELEREHKQRQRERERERKPSLFNPFHSCRGKVWLPQLECINKSAFSFPFKTTPITTLTQVTVCIFLIWFIYYWISVEYRQWHRLCKVTLITFDCMWGFLMEARSEMCPCSTPTVASYPT